jgi:hypothetical protein
LTNGANPEEHACQMLPSRLSEALSIPVLQEWAKALWEAGIEQDLITELTTGGDILAGFAVQLTESVWVELVSRLLKESKFQIPLNQ